jgi:hypothetical protein
MSEDNVINLPTPMDVLANRIRAAYKRATHSREEWIEGTLELAAALAEARGRFPADRQFSHWLVDADLQDISHQDRAALIAMAADPPTARQVLEETKRSSWQLVWEREMKSRFTSASKPTGNQAAAEETTGEPAPLRGRLAKVFRGCDISAAYTHHNTRGVIGAALTAEDEVAATEVRDLILKSIDVGFITQTPLQFERLSLRVLFPSAPKHGYCYRFDLMNKADREQVISRIMPAALANRDKVIAAPDQLESIVEQHWTVPSSPPTLSIVPAIAPTVGYRIQVPDGMTVSDLARKGIAILAEQQVAVARVAKQIGLSLQTFCAVRDIVLLSQRNDLSAKDAQTVRLALQEVDETRRVAKPYERVKPIAQRIWGSKGNRLKTAERRIEQFEAAVNLVLGTTESAMSIVIPYITPIQAEAAIHKLSEAENALRKLKARIEEACP